MLRLFLLSLSIGTLLASELSFAGSLGVVSYNVWGLPRPISKKPQRYARIGGHLDQLANAGLADIAGLQETFVRKTARIVREAHAFPYEAQGEGGAFLKLSSGLRTLSRFPILSQTVRRFDDCAGIDCVSRKGALIVTIQTPDGPLLLLNTHLNAAGPDSMRVSQIRQIADWLAGQDQTLPLIMTGDYNFTDDTISYGLLMKELGVQDAWAVHRQRNWNPDHPEFPGFTYNPFKNPYAARSQEHGTRYDYVFYRNGKDVKIELEDSEIIFDDEVSYQGKPLSDHFGIRAKFQITRMN